MEGKKVYSTSHSAPTLCQAWAPWVQMCRSASLSQAPGTHSLVWTW